MLLKATLTACSSHAAASGIALRSLSTTSLACAYNDTRQSSAPRWGDSAGDSRGASRGGSSGGSAGWNLKGRRTDRFGQKQDSDQRSRPPSNRDSYASRDSGAGPGDGNRNFYNRSERFAPDGSRKRPTHPNNRDRNPRSFQLNSQDRSPPQKDRFQASSSDTGAWTPDLLTSKPSQHERLEEEYTPSGDRARSFRDRPDRASRQGRTNFAQKKRYKEEDEEALDEEEDEPSSGKRPTRPKAPHFAVSKRRDSRQPLDIFDEEGVTEDAQEMDSTYKAFNQPKKKSESRSSTLPGRLPKADRFKVPKLNKEVFLPPTITVASLGQRLGVKMRLLQTGMANAGYEDTRPDLILTYEDAELIAAEFKAIAVVEADDSFDIVHRPPVETHLRSSLPLRSPVVTIMGHVDHGKTTLLDTLRKTTTAKGEPGGITQHIAAFSVPIKGRLQDKGATKGYDGIQRITFFDTPGHAAFTAMRSRGAMMTDIVVLVVAADDGVMPQTLEVINLVKESNVQAATNSEGLSKGVQLLVAINKTDILDVDPDRVKRELLAAGVELEEFGGTVPCLEVSGKTGKGLEDFEETLAVMAELAELRAEATGPCEGYVIESRVDKGNGDIATVLVQRGVLKKDDSLIAGTAWCKVRRIIHSNGQPLAQALPGEPVIVTGWRVLPSAGDQVIGGSDMDAVKKAVSNRKIKQQQLKLMEDVTVINEQRRQRHDAYDAESRKAYEERLEKRAARIATSQGKDPLAVMTATAAERESQELAREEAKEKAQDAEEGKEAKVEKKYLNLLVKGDVTGSVEAVLGAITGIGNAEAGVRIISASAGEVTETDVTKASALGGAIVAFNVEPSKLILGEAAHARPLPVQVVASDVIYRLMEEVKTLVSGLLEPTVEARVQGEATVSQIFDIDIKGKRFKRIAGCKVTNGNINRANLIRVLRGPERKVIWQGKIDDLKQVKKDVTEMRKGTECGISFDGFQDIQENDSLQSIIEVSVARSV